MWELLISWSLTDWISILSGLLYVILAAKGKRLCWVFGIASCSIIAYEDFSRLKLYADGILQIVYVILGFTGLFQWGKSRDGIGFSFLSQIDTLKWWISATLLSLPFAVFFYQLTDAAYPFLDAWTTAISLIATWLTIKKVVHNWIFWIVADIIYIFLYFQRDAPAFAFLFIIYTVVAIYGWFSWRKMARIT